MIQRAGVLQGANRRGLPVAEISSAWGSERPEKEPVALSQRRTGGSPGQPTEASELRGAGVLMRAVRENRDHGSAVRVRYKRRLRLRKAGSTPSYFPIEIVIQCPGIDQWR